MVEAMLGNNAAVGKALLYRKPGIYVLTAFTGI